MPAPRTSTEKHIACASIMNGCSFEATAPTEAELLKMVTVHAAQVHGMAEITPELAAKVKAAIQDRPIE